MIERQHARLAEERVHPLGVNRDRVGRKAVVADSLLFRQFGRHGLVPHNLAIVQPHRNQMPFQLFQTAARLVGNEVAGIAGQVDAIAEGDRTGRTGAGQSSLPHKILGLVPFQRQAGGVGDPHAAGTAKARPVVVRRGRRLAARRATEEILIGLRKRRDGDGKLLSVAAFDSHLIAVEMQHAGLDHPAPAVRQRAVLALAIARLSRT